ncbi:MAG: rRNA pseudouridine synthase [Candidatus Melainabacteria bacterium]|jgi:23S rRNA pseudouridine2604 synthase|nr:rRNA pseudouridine synthase [Candidatus Melainabacteria bacterium]
MRINKFIAQLGLASRREADRLIELRLILVNNKVVELGQQIEVGDELSYKGKTYQFNEKQKHSYYAFNKPSNVVCTCAEDEPNNIISYIQKRYPETKKTRLYPVGRLDKNSRGLILLTNDGDLSQTLSHPKHEHEKEYLVTCTDKIDYAFIEAFCKGVTIYKEDEGEDDERVKTKPCKAKFVNSRQFTCILEQGYKRQIRKMVVELNNRVKDLQRIRIAGLKLANLAESELIKLEYSDIFADD